MPTSIKDIVAHRAQLLRTTLRDTPEQVIVAIQSSLVRAALRDKDKDETTLQGWKSYRTRLKLASGSPFAPPEDAATLERLGRRRPENVIIAKRPVPHRSTVWVRDGYNGYRSAFKAFIKTIYGNVDFDGFDEMEVDHLASRGQKRMGGKFIRIEAVDKSVNRSHGASVEKKQAAQKGRGKRDMDGLTLLSVLKLYGLKPPTSPNDGQRMEEIRRTLKADGWDKNEVSRGIQILLALYSKTMD